MNFKRRGLNKTNTENYLSLNEPILPAGTLRLSDLPCLTLQMLHSRQNHFKIINLHSSKTLNFTAFQLHADGRCNEYVQKAVHDSQYTFKVSLSPLSTAVSSQQVIA